MRSVLCFAVFSAGCAEAGDVAGPSGSSASFAAPDIQGSYDVEVSTSVDTTSFAWLAGDLVVSGSPDALTWDFDEVSFSGTVDEAFAFDFAGTLTSEPGTVVSGGGTVFVVDGVWNLDGDVLIDTQAVSFLATQVLP